MLSSLCNFKTPGNQIKKKNKKQIVRKFSLSYPHMSVSTRQSKVSQFLLDSWSTAKVVLPSAAVQIVIHQTVLKKLSLRELTLGLTLLNAIWFTTSLDLGFFETPLLANVPSLDEWQKLDVGRHRFSFINKIEASILTGVILGCYSHSILLDYC